MDRQNFDDTPLYVDLDGTLIKGDLLYESFIEYIKKRPFNIFQVAYWLRKGKAYLKHKLAEFYTLNAKTLPYNSEFLAFLKEQQKSGRKLILATAANKKLAKKIATDLNLFTETIASDEKENISGRTKLQKIEENCHGEQFDYAGNSLEDIVIFKKARRALLVNCNKKLTSQSTGFQVSHHFDTKRSFWQSFLKAIRPQHWIKNILLFVPIFVSNRWFEWDLLSKTIMGFFAFSFTASSVYIINDIMDIQNDRFHVKKKYRPFAAGDISIKKGCLLYLILVATGLSLSISLDYAFFVLLIIYLLMNGLYSAHLKNVVLIDIIFLSLFYTIRIVSGGFVTNITPSFWLLSFSVFIFFSLAIVKRYTELAASTSPNGAKIKGRGYYKTDLIILNIMGLSSGYLAVLVMALYINSPDVALIYSSPKILWGVCLFLFYWISYIWIKTNRGELDEDPILFAIKDKTCQAIFLLILANVMTSIVV